MKDVEQMTIAGSDGWAPNRPGRIGDGWDEGEDGDDDGPEDEKFPARWDSVVMILPQPRREMRRSSWALPDTTS